ncbi:Carbonic anhydrase [Candidatus Burkholderia humilis]|nr:Carbonic anhydrase [Candidatus Burkholderia humilis]
MRDALPCPCARRRRFLIASAAALPINAQADALTKAQRDAMSPDEIIEDMKHGNARFQKSERKARNYLREQRASAAGQYPAAVLLSCIDSRAPAEVIMDLGIGDIFNCRGAGNVENDDILGSIEFACKLMGAKVVLVMGHTACGTIKGAIANVELGHLTQLLDRIKPAVQQTRYDGERTAANCAFVDAVARTNVELTLATIRGDSPILAGLDREHMIKLAGAMYDLKTGAVDFFA